MAKTCLLSKKMSVHALFGRPVLKFGRIMDVSSVTSMCGKMMILLKRVLWRDATESVTIKTYVICLALDCLESECIIYSCHV